MIKKLSFINQFPTKRFVLFGILAFFALSPIVVASGGSQGHGLNVASTFIWIAIILIAAKLASLIEKCGQPAVLGELLIGVILGNLGLLGLHLFEPILHDPIISFLAELGVVILLFQIGLESNISEMKKVGKSALGVAIIGVVIPFVLGTYVVGPWLMPGLENNYPYLFLGAAMTATSVGITARVFKDLKKLKIPAAQIVLGAAVIDDILGLIILAVVSALVTAGAVSFGIISMIVGKAVLFLVGSIVVGHLIAPSLGKILSKIHNGPGMKFTLAIAFGLIFAGVAQFIGLAPIVGAFAAGLVLDAVHFRHFKNPHIINAIQKRLEKTDPETKNKITKVIEKHAKKHIEELIEPLAHFLVPIFFVVTGMTVKLDVLFDGKILLIALLVTIAAFLGKMAAGLAVSKKAGRALVGFGMVPRGEVGLIFASIGKQLGVVNDEIFSIIVIMVIFTTLLTPPILTYLLKKQTKKEKEEQLVTV